MYHITVDNVPFCATDLTLELCGHGGTRCQHDNYSTAVKGLDLCEKRLPGHAVKLVTGRCPQPNAMSFEEEMF